MEKVKGRFNSDEWWDNVWALREKYLNAIEDCERSGENGKDYQNWLADLRVLDKMIGDAGGVFKVEEKGLQKAVGNTHNIIVVMPNQQVVEKQVENTEFKIIDQEDEDVES